jgi:hypothetical protein
MTAEQAALKEQADRLYEQYGKPLESQHQGEYVAIFPDGKTIIGPTRLQVADQAVRGVGRGSFLFKIGEKAVGRWR